MTVPAPPDPPAENCKSALPLITPFTVISFPPVAPIAVFIAVLLVIVAVLDKLVPVDVAAIFAMLKAPVPPVETILIGTEMEELTETKFIRCVWVDDEPCAELIVIFADPVPLMLPTPIVPLAGVVTFTFGENVKPTLFAKTIGPVNVVVPVGVKSSYPVVLK